MLEVERAHAGDASLALLDVGRTRLDLLLALGVAGVADLARELGRLGTDEPRRLLREEEVEVLERLAGGFDVCVGVSS